MTGEPVVNFMAESIPHTMTVTVHNASGVDGIGRSIEIFFSFDSFGDKTVAVSY